MDRAERIDWIIFGDDWGLHVSTTQHLVLNLPATDRVIWVDSIGMREPRPRLEDARRLWHKGRGIVEGVLSRGRGGSQRGAGSGDHYQAAASFARVRPQVIPFHFNPFAHRFNSLSLQRSLRRAKAELGIGNGRPPVLVTVNPVVVRYFDAIEHGVAAYLRLDNYARFPGVDPELVERTEEPTYRAVDAIFATARALLPGAPYDRKAHYLPQGVQFDHFAQVPLEPSGKKVLGFYGLISEYINFELVERVARAAPDWALQFVGAKKRESIPASTLALPNVGFADAVPFAELPALLGSWGAAWAPYVLDEHTMASNPLKVREYLASGLPSHCTSIPEAAVLQKLRIADDAATIVEWLREIERGDDADAHQERRASVATESWASRSETLREVIRRRI